MIFVYLMTLSLIFCIIYKLKTKTLSLPKLILTKKGLVFYSQYRHKIFVGNIKIMTIDNFTYLKQNEKLIIIKNVTKTELKKDFLYFTAMGKVEIFFNCKKFYKAFNINIKSESFDLEQLKSKALVQLINNLFNIQSCNLIKRYLYAINNILNIKIDSNSISVSQNKYFLPFFLTYKLNNTLKTIKFNQKV